MNEITKRNTEVQIEMGYNTNGIQEVLLRDYALAQPRVYIEGLDPHKVDFGDYFTKEETLALLSGKVNTDDLSGYYTKAETDGLMNDKADADSLSAFYTKDESDAFLSEKVDTEDLSAFYTKDEVDGKTEEIIDQLFPKDIIDQSADLIVNIPVLSGGCRYKFTQPKNKIIIGEAKTDVDEAEIYVKFTNDYTISGITSALTIGGFAGKCDEDTGWNFDYADRKAWTLTQTDPTAEGTDRVFQTTFTGYDPGYTDKDSWSAGYDTETASWTMRCWFDSTEKQWVIVNSYSYNDNTTSGYFAKGKQNFEILEAVEWEITSNYGGFLPLGNYNQDGLDSNNDGEPGIRKPFVEQNGGAITYIPEISKPQGFTFVGEPELEDGVTYAISFYNKLIAVGTVGEDAIEINPFEIEVKDAEIFGYLTSGSFVSVNSNDKVSYWSQNTIIPTGSFYWSDIFNIDETSENLWVKISNTNISNTTPLGLHEAQTLNGDIHILYKDSTLYNSAGAGQKKSKCKNIYVVYDNVTTIGANYSTMGYVDNGDVFIDVKNSRLTSIFYGGTGRNKTNNFQKIHNVYATYTNTDFTITNGTNSLHILAGVSSKTNTNSASVYSVVNDIFVTLNEGNVFNTNPSKQYELFAGGYYSDSNDVLGGIINNINLVINGGRYFDLSAVKNGEGIFAGPFVSSKSKVQINNINIEVNGGEISDVFGGGYAQQNGIIDILGDVKITINGGTITNVVGLSTNSDSIHSGTGYAKYHGNIYIYLNGGSVGYVHPGERHAASTSYAGGDGKEALLGEGYVILSGNQNWSTHIQGNILHQGATTEPHNTLIFDNYTGTLTAESQLIGFRHCIFKENSNVKIESEIINMYPVWEVDLSRRSVECAGTPVLSGFAPSGIDLTVDDHNILSTWVIDIRNEFPPSGINVYYNGSSIATVNTPNTAISGENPFSGWGFSIEDGKLLFKEL